MAEETSKPKKTTKKQDPSPGDTKPELEFGAKVSVHGEPGVVTGVCYDRFDDVVRWSYRIGAGWFTAEQLQAN